MKLSRIFAVIPCIFPMLMQAEDVTIDESSYRMDRLIERQIGPGTTYLRLRFPDIPLNVNMVIADLSNEYLRVENSVANESAKGTELISKAAARLSAPGHKPIAGQNANFWAVSSQAPDGKMFSSQTRNVSIRNGKLVTECNMGPESPFGGPVSVTGLMAISPDKEAYIDFCRPSVVVRINDGIALYTVRQCNKGVHPDEIGMYDSFYGADREFRPIAADRTSDGFYQLAPAGDATEVLLDLAEGEEWMGGRFINFVVSEVRTDAGHGTLGNHDLALVARGSGKMKIGDIKAGDRISLKYAFQFSPSADSSYPLVETAIGGNLLMMRDGQVLSQCNAAQYDNSTYARSLYGTSADGKKLYMMVIDKSTHPVYGRSAGLNTSKAAQIARHFGCSYMMQCDGGGSAELYVTDKIVNKTTESTPRAVANALMLFDNSPTDTDVESIAIDSPGEIISLPTAATFSPVILLYNRYGSLLDTCSDGFTLTCSEGLGTVSGTTFTASSVPVFGTITVTYAGKSVTREVSIGGAIAGLHTVMRDSDTTLMASPSPVGAGEKVTVSAPLMTHVEVHNLAGQLITGLTLPGTDSCTLTAPSTPGLYIITAMSGSVRYSAKLIVV